MVNLEDGVNTGNINRTEQKTAMHVDIYFTN